MKAQNEGENVLIINADDLGRSRIATDRILSCYKQGTVSSASAMVFMEDSQRAADLALECGIEVGLHLNFTQELALQYRSSLLGIYHTRTVRFLRRAKYTFLIYNPALQKEFKYIFHAQLEEFERLYGIYPSHINGHHHMHLCANMLIGKIIPEGHRVRRNFTYTRREKNLPNRMYRAAVDKWLAGRYLITDFLFSLRECMKGERLARALALAEASNVEFETHPESIEEYHWLIAEQFTQALSNVQVGSYSHLGISANRLDHFSGGSD